MSQMFNIKTPVGKKKEEIEQFILCLSPCFRIDAPDNSSGGILRFANDDWTHPNCKMERIIIDEKPRLFLKAISNIQADTELRYDYHCPDAEWRKVRKPVSSLINNNTITVSE